MILTASLTALLSAWSTIVATLIVLSRSPVDTPTVPTRLLPMVPVELVSIHNSVGTSTGERYNLYRRDLKQRYCESVKSYWGGVWLASYGSPERFTYTSEYPTCWNGRT